jgi:hypothetical protein
MTISVFQGISYYTFIMKKLIFAAFSLLNACVIFAQVTVTKPSLSFTACSYPSNYVSLGDIRIDETNTSDIASGNNQTILISAPVNFEFQSGIGTVQIAPGGDLKSNGLAINVTSSTVTITFDCTGTTKSDIIQISGLRIRVLAAASNTFVRTGGSASINGFGIGTVATNTISSQTLPANTFRSVTNLTGDLAWNSSTTWECGSVPPNNGTANIIISAFNGAYSPLNAVIFNNFSINNLTIESGANFSPPGGSGRTFQVLGNMTIDNGGFFRHYNWTGNGKNALEIKGNFINNGEMTTTGSNNAYDLDIIFNGNTPQTISGSGIFRLIGKGNQISTLFLNNSKGVSLETSFSTQDVFGDAGAVVVNGLVTFGSSSNQFTGGGSLTFNGQTILKAATFYGHYAMTGTRTFGTSTTVEYTNVASNISSTNIPILNLFRLTSNVGNNGVLTVSNNMSVSDILSLTSGRINLGSNTLTVGVSQANKGLINYTSGIIQGKLKRWFNSTNAGNSSGIFPLGIISSGTNTKRFVSIEYTQATDGGTLTAEWIPVAMGYNFMNDPVTTLCNGDFEIYNTASGYWSMTPGDGITNAENKTYNITLHAEGLLDFSDDCHITALKRQGSNPWTQSGTHVDNLGDAISPNIQRLGASGWSNWGIGGGSGTPLPVELSSFTVNCSENGIDVNWTTDSEYNSASFELEQSSNGNDWGFISNVEAAGNSTEGISYSQFIAKSYKINYVRLRQIDINGEEKIYGPIAVNCNSTFEVITYPNPSEDNFNLIIKSAENNTTGVMQLIDLNGRVLLEKNLSLNEGINLFQIGNISTLVKGTYLIAVSGDSFEATQIKHTIK